MKSEETPWDSDKPCAGEAVQTLLIAVSTYGNSSVVCVVLPLVGN